MSAHNADIDSREEVRAESLHPPAPLYSHCIISQEMLLLEVLFQRRV